MPRRNTKIKKTIKRLLLAKSILIVLVAFSIIYFVVNDDLSGTVSCKVGEDCNKDVPELCENGYIFSQKDCKCVQDSFDCKGLDEEECERNANCFSFSRSGTCGCPSCEIYLSHQCLPK